MNNEIFDKSMEDVRKYMGVRLVTDAIKFKRLVARSNFLDRTHFTEDLTFIYRKHELFLTSRFT